MINKLSIYIKILFCISLPLLLLSCSQSSIPKSDLYPLQKVIEIPQPTNEQLNEFNLNVKSDFISLEETENFKFSGYRTNNKMFLEKVITPLITPHLEELAAKSPSEIINILTLFSFEIYQTYFGRNFYRWGGDILDLDDPQEKGGRNQFSFGLDCSGLSSMPYEIAVYFNLLNPEDVIFSSKGFELYCNLNNKRDVGGREGTSNKFRLDTQDFAELGSVVFSLGKNQIPDEEQVRLLQPGDIVGRAGHFGIIVEINSEPYYLESGGWVVPKNNGIPVKAIEAIKIFATSGPISIRRCLN